MIGQKLCSSWTEFIVHEEKPTTEVYIYRRVAVFLTLQLLELLTKTSTKKSTDNRHGYASNFKYIM